MVDLQQKKVLDYTIKLNFQYIPAQGENQLDLEHHCFKQHYLSTTPLDNFKRKSFPDRVIRVGASQTNLRTLVISSTIVLSTVTFACLISRMVRMICRLWKTLVLICMVIQDEKLSIFYGHNGNWQSDLFP